MGDVISCGAVVYRHNPTTQILLIKQNKFDDTWGIPKGHMESGETFVQTAKREVREETGINIRVVCRLPYAQVKKKKHKKTVVSFLAVQTCTSYPRCDDKNSEVHDVRWFDVDKLPNICTYQIPVIEAALFLVK